MTVILIKMSDVEENVLRHKKFKSRHINWILLVPGRLGILCSQWILNGFVKVQASDISKKLRMTFPLPFQYFHFWVVKWGNKAQMTKLGKIIRQSCSQTPHKTINVIQNCLNEGRELGWSADAKLLPSTHLLYTFPLSSTLAHTKTLKSYIKGEMLCKSSDRQIVQEKKFNL